MKSTAFQDLEAEKVILGACFRNSGAGDGNLPLILERVRSEDFAPEKHRAIFLAIQSLFTKGAPIDPITLHNELENQGWEILHAEILEIGDEYLPGLNLDYHIAQLRTLTKRRELRDKLSAILDQIEDPSIIWPKLLEEVRGEIQPLIEQQARTAGHQFKLVSAQELLSREEEERQWLWDGILPQGGMSLLVAKPKVGKSTLALNLAVAVSRGCPFLGRATLSAPVVYLALEEKQEQVQKALQALGVKEEPLHFHFGLAPNKALEEIETLLAETGAGLLIVDTLQKLARIKDLNDYAAVTRALEVPLAVARSRNCHILLTHHAGKADRMDGDEILGSTALLGAVDTAIILKKRESERRTMGTVQRYGQNLAETLILLQEDAHSLSIGDSLTEARKSDLWEEIKGVLGDHPGMTTEKIRKEVDCRKAEVVSTLQWAYGQRQVIKEGSGKRADPYRFTLNEFRSAVPAICTGTAGTESDNALTIGKHAPYSAPEIPSSLPPGREIRERNSPQEMEGPVEVLGVVEG